MKRDPRELPQYLEYAREAARCAADAIAKVRPRWIQTKSSPTDLVTECDLLSDSVLRAYLQEVTPDVSIVTEENGGMPDNLYWMCDPIDGTTSFAQGLPSWTISIALVYAGKPILGVVLAPVLQQEFCAIAGRGAWRYDLAEPERRRIAMTTSSTAQLADAVVGCGLPYDLAQQPFAFAEVERVGRHSRGVRMTGTAALDMCYVAAGWLDMQWERDLKPWDTAAAGLIVTEAGGVVSTFAGEHDWYRLQAANVMASAPAVHAEALAVLRGERVVLATSHTSQTFVRNEAA